MNAHASIGEEGLHISTLVRALPFVEDDNELVAVAEMLDVFEAGLVQDPEGYQIARDKCKDYLREASRWHHFPIEALRARAAAMPKDSAHISETGLGRLLIEMEGEEGLFRFNLPFQAPARLQ